MKTIAVLGTGNVAQTIAVDMKAKGSGSPAVCA